MLINLYTFTRKVMLLCISASMYVSMSGCEETGVEIDRPRVISLTFQPRVKDPLSFRVYVNGELFEGGYVKTTNNSLSVRITETASERLIFGGSFPVRPTKERSYITVYQYEPGGVPLCILPPEEEPLPPADYSKIAFLYDFPDFPDEVKAVIETSITRTSQTFEATDTLIVRKNEFSRFFLGRTAEERTRIKLYTTGDNSTQIGIVDAGQFSEVNNEFTMYIFKEKTGSNPPEIVLEKVY